MLRCNHNTLETYNLHEWIGVGILSILEIHYFLLVLVYIKINSEDSFLFHNRAYKVLRYFLGLQMILDDVPLTLHGPLADGAVEDPGLHFTGSVLGLVLGSRELVHRVKVIASRLGIVPHLVADLATVPAAKVPGHMVHPLHYQLRHGCYLLWLLRYLTCHCWAFNAELGWTFVTYVV